MAKNSKKINLIIFWTLFCVGLVIRIASSYFQYSGDVNNHIEWAKSFDSGSIGFYERSIPGFEKPNYPPLAIYLFYGSFKFWEVSNKIANVLNNLPIFPSGIVWFLQSKNALAMFMKIPGLLADIFIFYWLLKNYGKKLASLFWLNPAFIYLSSVWGQLESLTTLFLILAIHEINKNRNLYSSNWYSLGFMSKQTVLWLYPVLLNSYKNFKSFTTSTAVFFGYILVLYLPFYGLSTRGFSQYLSTLSGSSTVVSDKAFNLWGILYGQNVGDDKTIGFLSIRVWSIVIMVIFLVLIWFVCRKDKNKFNLAFMLSMLFFFLQTRVHERHLYPAVLLLLLSDYKYKFVFYVFLSIYLLSNLYWSLGLPFV